MNIRLLVLTIHIIAGFTALISGPFTMVLLNNKRFHSIISDIFFAAMTVVCATAIALFFLGSQLFLLLIAIFSYYFVFSGYRAFRRKNIALKQYTYLDWFVVLGLLLSGIVMIVLGLTKKSLLSSIFGSLACFIAISDIYVSNKNKETSTAWLERHIDNFMGSYMATVTAFSVTNFYFLPQMVSWLWPTVIGVPALYFIKKYYLKRYKR